MYGGLGRAMPKRGQKVTTPEGDKGRVVNVDILKRFVTVDLGEGKTSKVVYAPVNNN